MLECVSLQERIAEQKLAGTFLTKEQKDKIKERQEKAATMQQAYGMELSHLWLYAYFHTSCCLIRYDGWA